MTNTIEKIEKDVDEKLNTVAQELNKVFNGDEVSVNKIAAELSLGELALNKLPGRLKSALEENNYLAIGAHFSDSYDKKILRKSLKGYEVNTETKKELYTVFIKGGNEGKSTQFPYDYTDKNSGRNVDWYSESLGLGGGMVRILVVQMTTI